MPTYVDESRHSENVIFDPEVSNEIIAKAIEDSAFMRLMPRMEMPGSGKKFQTIEGDPVPEWVAETNPKPVGKFSFGKKVVEPYKMSIIVPFSNEFRRDKNGLYNACVNRLPRLFGRKFDATMMSAEAPGENFDVLGGAEKLTILPDTGITVYDRFVAIDAEIGEGGGFMTGVALGPKGRSIVLGAKSETGYPIFTPGVQSGQINDILGAGVSVSKGVYVPGVAGTTPDTVGVAGDFDECAWGAVEAIQGSITDAATLYYKDENNQDVVLPLWQRNMFAVRFEIELGSMIRDLAVFKLLTGNTPATTTTTTTTTTGE